MLHTRFHGHTCRPIGSGEDEYLFLLSYMGVRPSRSCDAVLIAKTNFRSESESE